VGLLLGVKDGLAVGTEDGLAVGAEDGLAVGDDDGSTDGEGLGRFDGVVLGTTDGMFGGPSQKSHVFGHPSRTIFSLNHLPQYLSAVCGVSQSHFTCLLSTSLTSKV